MSTSELKEPVSPNEGHGTTGMMERWVFSARPLLLLLIAVITLFLGYQAVQLRPIASFEKMIPTAHPYIQNYIEHQNSLKGLSNAVRIVVETTEGDIFTPEFQETLKNIHDEVFFINGVDRAALKSLWAASVRWLEVTEYGFDGGRVIPDSYDGSPESIEQLRINVLKSGQVGTLVANNFKSAMIYAPLYDRDPQTGQQLDYARFSEDLERLVRNKYQTDTIKIHITGFAKIVGDLIDGLSQVFIFFGCAFVITGVMLYGFSRSISATLTSLLCASITVIWLLGILHLLGFGLNPYSMLVPFLVFAISISHAVQLIHAIAHESAAGATACAASRYAFRSLYVAGMLALVSDGVGFATLMIIDIPVIQELAIAASIGVLIIILTKILLLPVIMSYIGVSEKCCSHFQRIELRSEERFWKKLSGAAGKKMAPVIVAIAGIMVGVGFYMGQDLKIGDLDPGAPELRPDSRYNKDNAFIGANYSTSADVFVVMVESKKEQCANYKTLDAMSELQWALQGLPGVQSTYSLADFAKAYMIGTNEGNLKWQALNRNQQTMNAMSIEAPSALLDDNCSLVPILVFLNDHKAATLESVVTTVDNFIQLHQLGSIRETRLDDSATTPLGTFMMAAGNAGIEATTNIVIKDAEHKMLFWEYSVIGLLVLLTFRSWRALVCIMLPLMLTSILCQGLMAHLGIGVKVATLPVIALGVGIGVDYGIYIYSKLSTYLKKGMALREAYYNTLITTGKAVAFTGFALAVAVGTWYFSPIKFQADMGLLLIFLFLGNMLGAMLLLPALAFFLQKPEKMDEDAVPAAH